MHKLIEYICDELDEIERKADKDGKLSMQEVQYADTLAHMKKNLLKAGEMMGDDEYSMEGGSSRSYRNSSYEGSNARGSYARSAYARERGGRSNSMRRGGSRRGANQYGSYDGYSMAEDFKMELEELIEEAPNEQVKRKMRELMNEV